MCEVPDFDLQHYIKHCIDQCPPYFKILKLWETAMHGAKNLLSLLVDYLIKAKH